MYFGYNQGVFPSYNEKTKITRRLILKMSIGPLKTACTVSGGRKCTGSSPLHTDYSFVLQEICGGLFDHLSDMFDH